MNQANETIFKQNFFFESVSILDQIKEIPIAKERTLVICNELEEAEEVAKHLESNDVPVELVKNICSDCKHFVLSNFIHHFISNIVIYQ